MKNVMEKEFVIDGGGVLDIVDVKIIKSESYNFYLDINLVLKKINDIVYNIYINKKIKYFFKLLFFFINIMNIC